jgi:PIN domain nuclease of toxin-antitoxin system
MVAAVADTHAALWHLFDDDRLSVVARAFLDEAAAARHKILVSPISLAEVVYLVEKNRLPAAAYEDLKKALNNPNHVLQEAPLTAGVVEALRQVPRDVVPDMPDRIVAATALYLGVPVISGDARIRAAKLQTVW